MPPHSLINFQIKRYYQKKPKFNGVYSRNNLTKIKDEAYIINLDEYETIATHWIALYVNNNNVTYFDSSGVENIPKEIRKFIGNKNIITNIYRIQAYNSVMCGYFCIGFTDFMLKGKRLLGYINSFCSNDYQKNHKNHNTKIFSIIEKDEKNVLCYL